MRTLGNRRTQRHAVRRLLPALLACALVAGACSGSDTDGSATGGTTATTAPTVAVADEAAYAEAGPYEVGATTLDLDGRIIEVWYPADPGTVAEAGAEPVVFEIRDLLPDNLKSLVPDELNPRYETAAYADIPASGEGPFPLVLFAHGFAAYPTEYQFMTTHLASWGFVVAAPDFEERGLLAAFAGSTERADETAVMGATRQLMAAQSAEPGGLLEGVVDADNVGTIGHSAGVAPAIGAAVAEPEVKTFIAMSGGFFREGEERELPDKPGMVMTGGRDEVAAFDRVRGLYDAMTTPKRLVVVDEAGHNSFNDLCVIGAEQGGLLQIATDVGITPTEQISRLFLDGCSEAFLEARQVWPVANHFVTAQLRFVLGVDAEPVGLGPGVVDQFAPVAITYEIAE